MTKWSPKQVGMSAQETIRFRQFRKWRWRGFSIASISIVLFIVLAASYVVVINVVSTKGAQIHSLELTKKSLVAENERLAVEAARLQSLAVIEKGATEQIEIGDNGEPTGRVKPDEATSTDGEPITYKPKMVPMISLSFLEDESGTIAKR